MPNYETIPVNRTGKGPPAADLGVIGDRYTDEATGELYAKRKSGWTNRSQVVIHPTIRQKSRWVNAARRYGFNLEEWAFETLDEAVPNEKPLDPSLEAGSDVPAEG